MEVVASLSQVRTAAAQCGLFTHKSVPVIFEPPCIVFVCHSPSKFVSILKVSHVLPFKDVNFNAKMFILPT